MSCENCLNNGCSNSISQDKLPKNNFCFFILTNQCNLACKYCFVNQNVEKMSYTIALDATNFLIANQKKQDIHLI